MGPPQFEFEIISALVHSTEFTGAFLISADTSSEWYVEK
jgi:hypothetical protein